MTGITFIVLTYNEEIHIERCLKSLLPVSRDILVVDSFSDDETCSIAERMGARVVKHAFVNQAQQFNWALEHCDVKGTWVWRVDADEYISDELGKRVLEFVNADASRTCSSDEERVNGIYVNKKIVFQGQPIMHGGWYPAPQIKVIRKGYGASENKMMDEHLVVHEGKTIRIDADQTDDSLHDLTWWSMKHVNYASRESINMLRMAYGMDSEEHGVEPKLFGNGAQRKRWLKIKYARSPLFVRPFLNFFIRYMLKAGFLDGKQGFVWYILQGFWYRMLVDAKIYELKKRMRADAKKSGRSFDDVMKRHLEDAMKA